MMRQKPATVGYPTYRPTIITIMARIENNNRSKIILIRNPFLTASLAFGDFQKTTPPSSSVMPLRVWVLL